MSDIFVPDGESRRDTAILLVGTADEYGIDQRQIRATNGGFYVPSELADVLYEGDAPEPEPLVTEPEEPEDTFLPADHTVEQVKDFAANYPDLVDDLLRSEQAGKNRDTLVSWLITQQTSGNRAEENKAQDEE